MDGVRRPGRLAQTAGLARQTSVGPAAAVATMSPFAGFGASLDGIRRYATETAELPAPTEILTSDVSIRRFVSPYAMASVALVPLVAVASVGLASRLLTHSQASHVISRLPVATPATVTPKPLVQSAEAAAPATPTPAPSGPVESAQAGDIDYRLPLQQILSQFTLGQSTTYGLYVKNLTTGELAVSSPDYVFRSASFYKLFVANAILRRVDAGSLSLATAAGGGTGENINQCLNLMITISDNACGDALGVLAGWGALTTESQAQGYTATNLNQPMVTTPRDVATLFERLYDGSLLSPASNNLLLGLLKAQKVNNRLPQGLPAGTVMAHKTGDLYGFVHDGGIVYGPKATYLVVMMGAPGATPNQFARLSRILYNHFD